MLTHTTATLYSHVVVVGTSRTCKIATMDEAKMTTASPREAATGFVRHVTLQSDVKHVRTDVIRVQTDVIMIREVPRTREGITWP